MNTQNVLKVERVSGGYGKHRIIRDARFEVHRGEFFTLLGPNGSGKTTLFKLMTGLLPLMSGNVTVGSTPLASLTAREKAEMIAVLAQEQQASFDFTVEDIVRLGRYPHKKGLFHGFSREDQTKIEEIMEATNTLQFRNHSFSMLSGGEKQRVLLAKALVQEPKLLLLDEPTNHLDIHHTFQVLHLLKTWQKEKDMTILAILHDLNIASLYSDRIALLQNGAIKKIGDVQTLKNEKLLEDVYQVKVKAHSHPQLPKPQLMLTPHQTEQEEEVHFTHGFHCHHTDHVIHISFEQPLRTMSNSLLGGGLQWAQHFCNFRVPKHQDRVAPKQDVVDWMRKEGIPVENAIGMITAVNMADAVLLRKEYHGYAFMVMITACPGNAVDITAMKAPEGSQQVGTMNTMLFIDANLTDGAFINAVMSATEAKTKALVDLQIEDRASKTLASGTATDHICIATTQRGPVTSSAGSGTPLGKGIGLLIYEATKKALQNHISIRSKGSERS